ncbi:MAG: MFS transporter [Candidatus Omnitrophica bacterium]|nr:MFS transporter [Candidatus Omnitrophota bacterium]
MKKFLIRASILSISLLTVMASAAVSPALAKIKQAFGNVDITLIKLVLTIPSLLIIPSSLIGGWLAGRMNKKYLLLIGLVIYALGGIGGGLARNITELLIIRAFFGIGAGLIIPLSTSLIADFYEGIERAKMMGYSGSVSHFGGVIFLLLSGWLACISWRYAFFVYALALVIILMILFWLPETQSRQSSGAVKTKLPAGIYICAILGALMMIAFYAAPTNLAMFIENERTMYTSQAPLFQSKEELQRNLEKGTVSDGLRESFKNNGIVLSDKAKLALQEPGKAWSITDKNKKYIVRREKDGLSINTEKIGRPGIAGYLLSAMTLVGVVSGIILALLMRLFRSFCATIAIASMAIGYWALSMSTSLFSVLIAVLCIGFSSGVLMPLLLLEVARLASGPARAFAMAVLSVGVYLGQFASPIVLKWTGSLSKGTDVFRQQFNILAISLALATLVSLIIAIKDRNKPVMAGSLPGHH